MRFALFSMVQSLNCFMHFLSQPSVEEVQQTEGTERGQVEKERMGVRKYFLAGVPIADEGCSVFPYKKSDATSPAEYGEDKEEDEHSFFLPFFA